MYYALCNIHGKLYRSYTCYHSRLDGLVSWVVAVRIRFDGEKLTSRDAFPHPWRLALADGSVRSKWHTQNDGIWGYSSFACRWKASSSMMAMCCIEGIRRSGQSSERRRSDELSISSFSGHVISCCELLKRSKKDNSHVFRRTLEMATVRWLKVTWAIRLR